MGLGWSIFFARPLRGAVRHVTKELVSLFTDDEQTKAMIAGSAAIGTGLLINALLLDVTGKAETIGSEVLAYTDNLDLSDVADNSSFDGTIVEYHSAAPRFSGYYLDQDGNLLVDPAGKYDLEAQQHGVMADWHHTQANIAHQQGNPAEAAKQMSMRANEIGRQMQAEQARNFLGSQVS